MFIHTCSTVLQEKDASSDSEPEAEASASARQGRPAMTDSEEEEEEELPVFLWQPPKTTAALGEWEAHTRVQK